jgi:hypothetical protein
MLTRTAWLAAGFVAACTIVAVACAPDRATAPSAAAASLAATHDVGADAAPFLVTALRWRTPRAASTWSFVVDPSGTVVNNPTLGLHIRFPQGAVDSATTITVTAPEGPFVAYDFEPHGLHFGASVWLTQDLSQAVVPRDSALAGAYYGTGIPDIDPVTGAVTVLEYEPTSLVANGAAARLEITHFSGYVVASGRR